MITEALLKNIFDFQIKPRILRRKNSLRGSCAFVTDLGYEALTSLGYDVAITAGICGKAVSKDEAGMIAHGTGNKAMNPEANWDGHAWLVDRSTGDIIDFTNYYLLEDLEGIRYPHEAPVKPTIKWERGLLKRKELKTLEALTKGATGFHYKRTEEHTAFIKAQKTGN